MKKKNTFKLIADLYDTFPVKMIEEYATLPAVFEDPNYEAIEDHLKNAGATKKQLKKIQEFIKKQKDRTYSLCEAVADIAFFAGEKKFYSGDSREDMGTFISWAKEFEFENRGVQWGENKDYMEEIEKFTFDKLKKAKKALKNQ